MLKKPRKRITPKQRDPSWQLRPTPLTTRLRATLKLTLVSVNIPKKLTLKRVPSDIHVTAVNYPPDLHVTLPSCCHYEKASDIYGAIGNKTGLVYGSLQKSKNSKKSQMEFQS